MSSPPLIPLVGPIEVGIIIMLAFGLIIFAGTGRLILDFIFN